VISLVPRIAPLPPRQVPTADTLQTDAILMCRERASICPVDSSSRATAAARAAAPGEVARIEPHGAVTHGIDRGAEGAMAILVHRIGTTAIRP
jgi:hypothetical protein